MLKKDDRDLSLSSLKSLRNQLEIQKAMNDAAIEMVQKELKKYKGLKDTSIAG